MANPSLAMTAQLEQWDRTSIVTTFDHLIPCGLIFDKQFVRRPLHSAT
jgi:hypothetical protein